MGSTPFRPMTSRPGCCCCCCSWQQWGSGVAPGPANWSVAGAFPLGYVILRMMDTQGRQGRGIVVSVWCVLVCESPGLNHQNGVVNSEAPALG